MYLCTAIDQLKHENFQNGERLEQVESSNFVNETEKVTPEDHKTLDQFARMGEGSHQ